MTEDAKAPHAERTDLLRLPRTVDRLVALGDPHGDLIALSLVLEREARPGTAFVSVGDNVGYADGVLSSEVCRALAERKIPSVRGNHEAWSESGRLFLTLSSPCDLTPEALAWVRALPQRIRVEAEAAPGFSITVVHTIDGWGYVDLENVGELAEREGADVVLSGHTHSPAIYSLRRGAEPSARWLDPRSAKPLVVKAAKGARYVVDAGSLARPAPLRGRPLEDRATYAVVELSRRTLRLFSIDKRPRLEELLRRAAAGPPA